MSFVKDDIFHGNLDPKVDFDSYDFSLPPLVVKIIQRESTFLAKISMYICKLEIYVPRRINVCRYFKIRFWLMHVNLENDRNHVKSQ